MASPNAKIEYQGILDRKKMNKKQLFAYEAYCSLKARSKKMNLPPPEMTVREFMAWWLNENKKYKFITPTCGRKDHSKGYFWNNIELQEMADNSREAMIRNKTNILTGIKTGKKIAVKNKSNEVIAIIPSIRETAYLFDVSQRLVQFLVRKKYKKTSKINFILEYAI